MSISQIKSTLKDALWDRVKPCYDNFFDEDGDGNADGYNVVEDIKNGYLHIYGSYPTCGCYCSVEVAAFKDKNKDYTFVSNEEDVCSWSKELSSNKPLEKLFPVDFGIREFIPEIDEEQYKFAIFYLNFEIPRHGTETYASLELIPFGIYRKSKNVLSFGYNDYDDIIDIRPIYPLRNIVDNIKDEATLDYIINDRMDKISQNDMNVIENEIGGKNSSDKFESKGELRDALINLKKIYDLYCQIKYDSVTFIWDKNSGQFKLESKDKFSEKKRFIDFLKEGQYWEPIC